MKKYVMTLFIFFHVGALPYVMAETPIEPTLRLSSPATVDPDDMCFARTADGKTLIVVSDKSAGAVLLFDGAGQQLDIVRIPKPGNIDSRNKFPFHGKTGPIIVVNQREPDPQLRVLTIESNAGKPKLKLLDSDIPTGANYGGCLYRGAGDRFYFFSTTEGGYVQQFELLESSGKFTGRRVRRWRSPICEGAVADEAQGCVFAAEEAVGIRKLDAEPDGDTDGELILKVGDHGITGDLEGITLLKTGDKTGYLIVSDQNRNRFVVLNREAPHPYLGVFAIAGATHTDGVDVTVASTGKRFPKGVFACHTDMDDKCMILLTPLEALAERLKRL